MSDAAQHEDTIAPAGVMVGTDGTPSALRAVAWAATEAGIRRRPLLILHAAPYAAEAHPPGRGRGAAVLARAYTVARRREPGIEAHTELSLDAPVAALVHASRRAELLVVGLLGGHPGDTLVGSIAPALTARAHCPVTVVRSDHDLSGPRRPLVVGVKDVDAEAAALTVAFADAARHGSPLIVVHVQHRSAEEHRPLSDELEPWRARWPEVSAEVRVLHGGVGEQLLNASRRARSLVLGTTARNLTARITLGSTSRTLVRVAACPVTVVRRDLDLTVAGAPDRHTRVGS